MTIVNIKYEEKQTLALLTAVRIHLSSDIADSVANRFGDLDKLSCWDQEEINDDLLSKLNEADQSVN